MEKEITGVGLSFDDPEDRDTPGPRVFLVEHKKGLGPSEVEGQLRKMVAAFLATEDGRSAVENTSGEFNWGDVLDTIPPKFWATHDLRLAGNYGSRVKLMHDERLSEEDDESDDEEENDDEDEEENDDETPEA